MAVPVKEGVKRFREHGAGAFCYGTLDYLGVWNPAWNTITSRSPVGTNVFDRDWDLLVILDACRVDALRHVAGSVPWLGKVERMRSVGSMSAEWMLKTFTGEHRETIGNTAFVSGNIWSHRVLNDRVHEHESNEHEMIHRGIPGWNPIVSTEDFAHYETVYLSYEEAFQPSEQDRLHPDYGPVPHMLTDRAIAVGRGVDWDRLIVHYNLPHTPFISDAVQWSPGEITQDELMSGLSVIRDLKPEEKTYKPARRGEVSVESMRENYLGNLRLVLEFVEVLRQNVDAETVAISADHGEALGEYGYWGHPFGCPFTPVKTVPWAKTTAVDERTYESKFCEIEREPSEHDQREFLKDMGYLR